MDYHPDSVIINFVNHVQILNLGDSPWGFTILLYFMYVTSMCVSHSVMSDFETPWTIAICYKDTAK